MSKLQETENKQITLSGIIGWGLGALMLLSGVAAIFDGATVAGLSFLVGSFILMPPFRASFYKKTGKQISGPARFIIVIGLLMLAGANIPQGRYAEQSTGSQDMYVESYDLDTISGLVRGTLKNNSSNSYKYVQVEFNLYDASGNQIGSTIDNVNNLEPGGTWKFKAVVLENTADRAELKGITKF